MGLRTSADQRRWFNLTPPRKQYIVPVASIEHQLPGRACAFKSKRGDVPSRRLRVRDRNIHHCVKLPLARGRSGVENAHQDCPDWACFGLPPSTYFSKPCLPKQAQFSSSEQELLTPLYVVAAVSPLRRIPDSTQRCRPLPRAVDKSAVGFHRGAAAKGNARLNVDEGRTGSIYWA
jgi:hypothetical protein